MGLETSLYTIIQFHCAQCNNRELELGIAVLGQGTKQGCFRGSSEGALKEQEALSSNLLRIEGALLS